LLGGRLSEFGGRLRLPPPRSGTIIKGSFSLLKVPKIMQIIIYFIFDAASKVDFNQKSKYS
jgi:hypothetical protein